MADIPPHSTYLDGAHHFQINHPVFNSIAGNQYLLTGVEDLIRRLNPLFDASHTRNRKNSPPDSECFPGTREAPIREITIWANTTVSLVSPNAVIHHIYWLHGFAGCGKSSISLEVSKIYAGSGRLLASYFFFRGAGDRSTMTRFAGTLASQLMAAMPATASYIEEAVRTEPGLLTGEVSLTIQLERLVYRPFQAVMEGPRRPAVMSPFLIVVDGLDECEDKHGVEEFIGCTLAFFKTNPSVPLRLFIASRIEEHIRARLRTNDVRFGNLDSHSSNNDIEEFLSASFKAVAERDRVVQAYIRRHGSWPTPWDRYKLVKHIGGSFVLASTLFKFIVEPAINGPSTPMERLPLALEMNGLDGLYAQTLARSQNIPHFRKIISTIALANEQLTIVGIADLLGLETFQVVCVLVNLQAIIHVPGTDEEGKVTVCHTSLRDFLTTESRAGPFFVPVSFHLHLSYYFFCSTFEKSNWTNEATWLYDHWRAFVDSEDCDRDGVVDIDMIEQFKACESPDDDKALCHMFLCSFFFYAIIEHAFCIITPEQFSYMLAECVKYLALAAECRDHRILTLWLERPLYFELSSAIKSVLFTERTYKIVRHYLRRASAAISVKFPEALKRQACSTGTEAEYFIEDYDTMGAIDILDLLEWMVARAEFKWDSGLKLTPRPPLEIFLGELRSHERTFSCQFRIV